MAELSKNGLRYLLGKIKSREPKLILDWKPEYQEGDVIYPDSYDATTQQFGVSSALPDWVTEAGVEVIMFYCIDKLDMWVNMPYANNLNSKITRIDDTHFTVSTVSGLADNNISKIGFVRPIWFYLGRLLKKGERKKFRIECYYANGCSPYSDYLQVLGFHYGGDVPGFMKEVDASMLRTICGLGYQRGFSNLFYESILDFRGDNQIIQGCSAEMQRFYHSNVRVESDTFSVKKISDEGGNFKTTGLWGYSNEVWLVAVNRLANPYTRVKVYELPLD